MRKLELIKKTKEIQAVSYWDKAVKKYAAEIIDTIDEKENYANITEKELLNGAKDWTQYSESGLSLIYDEDIARRVCTPSEYKRKKEGIIQPNATESWLDVQARALYQASAIIIKITETARA